MSPRTVFIEAAYLAASVLFILGLRSLTVPDRARRGMQLAALGMLVAIVGTLLHHEIVRYEWILVGLAARRGDRVPARRVRPDDRDAAADRHLAHVRRDRGDARRRSRSSGGSATARRSRAPEMAALGFEVLFGALTVTGSFMAFGKLQELLPSRPVTFRGQNWVSLAMFGAAVALFVWLVWRPANPAAFYAMVALALVFGVSLVLPIGGADMPVVISLLNSYAGLASAATGFAIGNNVLIIAGALDGASGFILSIVMSRAMNRSFANVLFGAFGAAPQRLGPQRGGAHRPRHHPGGRRDPARLGAARHRRARLRDGGRAGAAPGPRARGAHREERRDRPLRHPPRRGPDAGAHERAPRRGGRPLRPAEGDGRDQRRVQERRRGARHRRERRREPGRPQRPVVARSTGCRS